MIEEEINSPVGLAIAWCPDEADKRRLLITPARTTATQTRHSTVESVMAEAQLVCEELYDYLSPRGRNIYGDAP